MQHMNMITVVKSGKSQLYAGRVRSTTRKFDGKYMALLCGDNVVMRHVNHRQTTDLPLVTELLTVSALSIGTLEELFDFPHEPDKIRAFYPLPVGEKHNPDELFIQIHFA
tara:strand:- start:3074 stop:3403 length:330 start_codon:yes stop_codon:yes gene_type:complete